MNLSSEVDDGGGAALQDTKAGTKLKRVTAAKHANSIQLGELLRRRADHWSCQQCGHLGFDIEYLRKGDKTALVPVELECALLGALSILVLIPAIVAVLLIRRRKQSKQPTQSTESVPDHIKRIIIR